MTVLSSLVTLQTAPETQEALTILSHHPASDPVAVASRLRKRFSAEIVSTAMTLHELRDRATSTGRFPHASEMLFTRAGYEQASSYAIATWRARRFAECSTVVDLCCGIGGDLMALATLPGTRHLVAVDLDRDHLAMALHNAHLTASTATTITGMLADVRTVDLGRADGVFIDPARRDAGGRFAHGDSEPPLSWCLALTDTTPSVGIKLTPGLDHALVPSGWELELIAVENDLKEAVLWSPRLATASRRATVLVDNESHTLTGDGDRLDEDATTHHAAPEVGEWFIDPNPAITRAGLVRTLAASLDARAIDHQIAFLVSSEQHQTPFARSRRIIASLPWDEKALRSVLQTLAVSSIDIRRRGLGGDVDAIAKRLRKQLRPRGTHHRACWIAMTRVDDRPWAIVCDESPDA